jgi:hypothetical protein
MLYFLAMLVMLLSFWHLPIFHYSKAKKGLCFKTNFSTSVCHSLQYWLCCFQFNIFQFCNVGFQGCCHKTNSWTILSSYGGCLLHDLSYKLGYVNLFIICPLFQKMNLYYNCFIIIIFPSLKQHIEFTKLAYLMST